MIETIEQLAAAVKHAHREQTPVVPWGAGTRMHLGGPPPANAQRLELAGLNGVLEYEPADLTITVEAGITLGALQAVLAPHAQWLPWDPPHAESATIGGLLASAASGPLRLGYGTPRDWLLGARYVLGDGRVIKSGGRVVKNVAGYDTHKLQIGAFGTLGIIAEVTFKVAPLPATSTSVECMCASVTDALALADRLRLPPLAPVALIIDNEGAPGRVLARYAGVSAAVERQVARAMQAGPGTVLSEEAAAIHWRAAASWNVPQPADALILRVGVRPAALPDALAALGAVPWVALPGVGVIYARWSVAALAQLAALRTTLGPLGGYAALEYAPDGTPPAVRWGPPLPTERISAALRERWDPAGILNPTRFAVHTLSAS